MRNLARHIDFLLRTNDCVILPGFGGFIAHTVPAYYASEEHLYYPPSRNISFNAAITMNDGLLAQSYMKSYQVDYARATYMIDIAIEELRDTLDEKGCVTLPRIGTIKQDIYQAIQFTPEASDISSPKHFGLGSFIIQELSQLQAVVDEKAKQSKHIITQTEKTYDLHINKNMLRHVLSTAAVLLLLLMISLPIGDQKPTDIASLHLIKMNNTTITQEAPAVIIEEASNDACTSQDSTSHASITYMDKVAEPEAQIEVEAAPELITEVTAIENEPIQEQIVKQENIKAEPQPTATPQTTPSRSYHIIVASLPSHRGADEMINQYTAQGYTNVSLVERDGRIRISLAQFTNKDEANSYLSTLRTNEAFENAWLLSVSN